MLIQASNTNPGSPEIDGLRVPASFLVAVAGKEVGEAMPEKVIKDTSVPEAPPVIECVIAVPVMLPVILSDSIKLETVIPVGIGSMGVWARDAVASPPWLCVDVLVMADTS